MKAAGLRSALFCLFALAGVLKASRLEVDFGRPWHPPAGPFTGTVSINPVWARQNVWLPWRRWDSAMTPRFEPYVTELALVMATGARPDGEFSVPDLYRDSAGLIAPFDPGHPLFKVLAVLKAKKVRPILDIGPVPRLLCAPGKGEPGPFGWAVDAPTDYREYHRYIKGIFTYLIASRRFTAAEMGGWGFQLMREPDNFQSWNPAGKKKLADPGNLLAYERLYDCTLAGMRDAGITANLALGNLMIPEPGIMGSKSSWTEPLLAWLASEKDNRCPERLVLPRIRSTRDTLDFSFTAYGGDDGQMGFDPRELATLAGHFRDAAIRHFPRNPIRISIGEGNLIVKRLLHRSEGSELGAAWNAAIYKISMDAGLHRYQQWGFVSARHISQFLEHGGLPSAPYNVIGMLGRMEGQPRREVRWIGETGSDGASYIDALASKGADGSLRLFAFHYRAGGGRASTDSIDVLLTGLEPDRQYTVVRYLIDSSHANYIPAFEKDLRGKRLSLETRDACMEYQFNAAQRAVWDANKEKYRQLATLRADADPRMLKADAQSRARFRVPLPPNSVVLLELKK
ncbi:MAG: Beta-xylosidase [Fibrobacteres bacterium]|nr:Beta-xylosidase [Fibrobacterota bacterium]